MWIEPVDEMRKNVSRRSLIIAAPLILTAIPVVSTALWYRAEQVLDARAAETIAALRRDGFSVSFKARHHGGWPLAATLAFDAPRITGPVRLPPGTNPMPDGPAPDGPATHGTLAWGAVRLILRIDPSAPATLTVGASPDQALAYTPDGTPGTQPRLWIRAGESWAHLRGVSTTHPDAHVAFERLAVTWIDGGRPVTTTLWGVAGMVLWRPHAAPDTTIAAIDAHAALLNSDALPAWLRPWPWTAPAAQIALVAPRAGETKKRLLVQSLQAEIGGAQARFAGIFASPTLTSQAPRWPDGDGTLEVDGAYAMLDRWLDWAIRHPNDDTVPIRLDPATIVAVRRLLPRAPRRPDRLYLPVTIRQGALDLPGNPWAHDVTRVLGGMPSPPLAQGAH